ncbi:hypothetical protein [Streptomyces odontomachi]|uniref:hypothetical protein n=1 Tax=Streptomyces odontomachi TaxID=2944940 RepID=UPI00210D9DC1|nr:hypothetical protein [Streptomyces sp. ODS25]
MTAQTPPGDPGDRRLAVTGNPPRRDPAARTAIGRAHGRHRTLLVATCVALVLAAIGDEAPGYDGPGPFIALAFAAMVALVRWRFVPLLVVAMSVFLLVGGLATPEFTSRLIRPEAALDFTAGWLQMLSLVAAALFAVASTGLVRRASR